jgi:hypothetical protein
MIAGTSNRQPRELKVLDEMAHALARTRDLSEIRSLRDKAEAARKYAQSAALSLKIQNRAAELKLLAERRAGELLGELIAHGGNRRSSSHDESLKLSDLGIDHNQSSRWRREAAVRDSVFEQYVADANRFGREITANGLLRLGRSLARERQRSRPAAARRYARDTDGAAETAAPPCDDRPWTGSGVADNRETTAELLDEMKNHRGLLEQVLAPHCHAQSCVLQDSEKRLVLRLLAELERFMHSLDRELRQFG